MAATSRALKNAPRFSADPAISLPRIAGKAARRGFTLLELLAVLAVVSLAAGLVLARVPHASALALDAASMRLADRLSEAREHAILTGRAVRLDPRDGLLSGITLAALDVGGTPIDPRALEVAADGDALAACATLTDAAGARRIVVLPPGFHRARVVPEAE
jgi:prepilin-type N-terminal cleavage/methylation domain-containing protein